MELISRDKAIVMLEDMEGRRDEDGYIRVYKSDVIANLRSLSSIEVRKEGRWIDDTYIDDAYDIKGVKTWGTKAKCSECGFSKIFIERHSGQYEFCPRCGAKMGRRADEHNFERD